MHILAGLLLTLRGYYQCDYFLKIWSVSQVTDNNFGLICAVLSDCKGIVDYLAYI